MGLNGTFDELPLADVIEMTSLGGKTGRLTLYDQQGAAAGELAFRDGRLVGAVCGELGAEKAFYALLALKEGAFDFALAADLDDKSCDLSTQALLMEGMRRLDELRRLHDELPASMRVKLLGGEAEDDLEARVLDYRGKKARPLGAIVEGLLVGGEADEYDALMALQRLAARGVVRLKMPRSVAEAEQSDTQGTST